MAFPETTLQTLLDYDGLIYNLTCGYWLKIDVRSVDVSTVVPHGVAYSMTMHRPDGVRVLGFDNSHRVPHAGGKFVAAPIEADHWHYDETDLGKPYVFVSAERLIMDYFAAVEAKLGALGLPFDVME